MCVFLGRNPEDRKFVYKMNQVTLSKFRTTLIKRARVWKERGKAQVVEQLQNKYKRRDKANLVNFLIEARGTFFFHSFS